MKKETLVFFVITLFQVCIFGSSRPKKSKYGGKGRANEVGFVISAYVPEYRDIDYKYAASQTSDLVLFSAEPTKSGGIKFHFHDEKLRDARSKSAGKLLLTVGGGGRSANFYTVSRSKQFRESFVHALYQTMQKYDLQGVDFDWEQPQNQLEVEAYSNLIVETAKLFKPKGLLITAALHPWNDLLPQAKKSLDRVHLMSYDYGKKHSTLRNAKKHVEGMLKRGFMRRQLVLGIPGYGRNVDNFGEVKTYSEIVPTITGQKEDSDVHNNIYFNNLNTVRKKVRYAIKQGLGGVFLWEAGHDMLNHDKSMLLAMKNYVVDKNVLFDQSFDVHDRVSRRVEVPSKRRARRRKIPVEEL